jgi:hypothetical protein
MTTGGFQALDFTRFVAQVLRSAGFAPPPAYDALGFRFPPVSNAESAKI